jgi:hypothetical protein
MVLDAHVAITPGGKPLMPETPAFEIPVAPVVVWVMLVSNELTHKVGVVDAAPTVLAGVTVIVPVALPPPQPPVKGME